MKKKIDILGRKIPVLAVVMALLIIGTASAALIVNYAVLTGTVEVTNPIGVAGDTDATTLSLSDDGAATFTVTNSDPDAIDVEVVTTLYLNVPDIDPGDMMQYKVTDFEGITMKIDDTPLTSTDGVYDVVTIAATGGTVETDPNTSETTFVAGTTIVPVTFVAVSGVEIGTYTIQVEVNPITVNPVTDDTV